MFKVSSTCGRNLSQSWRGQSISTVASAAMKCGNGALGGICLMVVQGGKLDVDCFGPDVLLDRGGTLVVKYIQCQMVAARFLYGDDFGECLYHGSIGARWHGPDNVCIKVVDVGSKHVLQGKVPVMFVYMVPIMALTNVGNLKTYLA
jgi:hypothetical protein